MAIDWKPAINFLAGPDGLGSQKAVAEALGCRPQLVSDLALGVVKKVEYELGCKIVDLGTPLAAKAKRRAAQ